MADENTRTSFGPNDWLIDEMYRQYRSNPDSVADSWRDFFSDYRPPAARAVPDEPAVPVAEPETAPGTGAAATAPEIPAGAVPLRGVPARIVENMEASLAVPTATTVRTVSAKLMEENRALLNHHLAASQGGKASFTHLIAWAIVRAMRDFPGMRATFLEVDGVPHKVEPEHLNLGLAVDVKKKDGSRALVVPCIKASETLSFAAFFARYNEILRKVATNTLSPDDFAGTNVSLTNPGMLGTSQSVPRLMQGQSCIIAAGAIAHPPEYQSADPAVIARLGVGKVMVLTSTYDHRVIQGAESGAFLGRVGDLLDGSDGFYEEIFTALEAPHEPFRLARDNNKGLSGEGLVEKQGPVLSLINMYRVRGHLLAHLNPLGQEVPTHSELELERYGLTVWDLDREFFTGGLAGERRMTLREILRTLEDAYCDTVGIEYMHIQDPAQKEWIQHRVEGRTHGEMVTLDEKRHILGRLNAAEAFERFLHTKYLGHKRFSLEGAESLIPTLDRILQRSAEEGIGQVVMGMAHRGRLNVLANVLGKSYEKIFREFEGDIDPQSREGTGDVKYHLGASGAYTHPDGTTVQITLASNPSHLEAVDPVVEGMARALQDVNGDASRRSVLPLLVHGEAAFAGQGVAAETLNMSALPGYRTGGTVHIVINNGIGFTTGPVDARSSIYATDVAKMVQAPIFHVNGDDPEACMRVVDLAFAFRQEFGKDVVVELIGYRRHGHNEADEPAFTQPLMYARIRDKRSIRKLYTETLVNRGDLSLEEAEKALEEFRNHLEAAFDATRESAPPDVCILPEVPDVTGELPSAPPVDRDTLQRVLDVITSSPDGFTVHPKLVRQFAGRRDQLDHDAVDWGTAELLAFGTLALEGVPVRMSGQDSRRGTFSQRHAVVVDFETGDDHVPLQHMEEGQAPFLIYDSPLSEYAVMGFEYGYSVARPDALVLWEAQFGDFVNGAQIVIDQFITAATDKWDQRSKLVLLLPHGFEGQGPEHSSARIERFLILAANLNMRVAIPSTAAQHFHLLRSQGYLEPATPLVVFTPKSLLRADAAKSAAHDFTDTDFLRLLGDPKPPANPTRLLLCSGKVAYGLMEKRDELGVDDTMIVRVEQLYPFPEDETRTLLHAHDGIRDVRWVQEEPQNMGPWRFVAPYIEELIGTRPLRFVGRPASGSPATGSARVHQSEQEKLLTDAFRASGELR